MSHILIFCRKNSRRIPNKSHEKIGGLTLLEHSILMGQAFPQYALFVSTDDEMACATAEKHGVNVIPRPKELAGDNSMELDSWKHAISHIESDGGKVEMFVSLPVTCPIRKPSHIAACINKFEEINADIIVTTTAVNHHPKYNLLRGGERFSKLYDDDIMNIRDDLNSLEGMTTACYVAKPDYVKATSTLLSGNVGTVKLEWPFGVDIDEPKDLWLSRQIYKRLL